MEGDPRIHSLLPWFVAGTLAADEAERFRAHLGSCSECARDLTMLERVRDQVERHGPAFFETHPTAERLVAFVDGTLPEDERGAVREHVALCATCALEHDWIDGRATATRESRSVRRPKGAPAPATKRGPAWREAALAVAAVVATIAFLFAWSDRGGAPRSGGVHTPTFLSGTERAATPTVRTPDGEPVRLLLEVDLPESAWPVALRIADAAGDTVATWDGVESDALLEDLYLYVECAADACEAGRSYAVTVRDASGTAELRFPFSVAR